MNLARRAFKAIEENFKNVFLPLSEIEKIVEKGKYLKKCSVTFFQIPV